MNCTAGDVMKLIHILKILFIALLVLHIGASGLVGFQNEGTIKNDTLDKVIHAAEVQDGLDTDAQSLSNESVFSRATILTLVFAVMGIVAFRRNSYN